MTPREQVLLLARGFINQRFLTNYKTHDEMMADARTSAAMIGFMSAWELFGKDSYTEEQTKTLVENAFHYKGDTQTGDFENYWNKNKKQI